VCDVLVKRTAEQQQKHYQSGAAGCRQKEKGWNWQMSLYQQEKDSHAAQF